MLKGPEGVRKLDPTELHETLAHLHEQLEDADQLDAGLRAELEQAVAEIRAVIEGPEAPPESTGEQLSDLALRFESNHPNLTEALGRVIRALSRMGV